MTSGQQRAPQSVPSEVLPGVHGWSDGCGWFVGRVGALAVALGVDAAVASLPVAYPDRKGSGGSAGTSPSGSTDSSSEAGPVRGSRPGVRGGVRSASPAAAAGRRIHPRPPAGGQRLRSSRGCDSAVKPSQAPNLRFPFLKHAVRFAIERKTFEIDHKTFEIGSKTFEIGSKKRTSGVGNG